MIKDPKNKGNHWEHVNRGSSYNHRNHLLRSAYRAVISSKKDIGFRICIEIEKNDKRSRK